MPAVTEMPCPACGSMLLEDGSCTNSACPSLQDSSGGQWEATDPEETEMKTKREWEQVIGRQVPNEGFLVDDRVDPFDRFTRDDFERRAGLTDE